MQARRLRWRERARRKPRRAPRMKVSRSSAVPCPLGVLGVFQQLRGPKLHLIAALQEGGLHEITEQRVRPVRPRAKPGMELAEAKPRGILQPEVGRAHV